MLSQMPRLPRWWDWDATGKRNTNQPISFVKDTYIMKLLHYYPDEINPMDTFWSPISAGIPAFPVIF